MLLAGMYTHPALRPSGPGRPWPSPRGRGAQYRFRWASRWKRARSMGIEAAMMVMAPSAVPKMKRFTVVTSNTSSVHWSHQDVDVNSLMSTLPMAYKEVIFKKDVMPALTASSVQGRQDARVPWKVGDSQNTHAHGEQGPEFFPGANLGVPDNLPRKNGQDDISGARVCCCNRSNQPCASHSPGARASGDGAGTHRQQTCCRREWNRAISNTCRGLSCATSSRAANIEPTGWWR